MAKKKLNTADITNELQSSAFFPSHKLETVQEQKTKPLSPSDPQLPEPSKEVPQQVPQQVQPLPSQKIKTNQASINASMLSRYQDVVEVIRKTVKQVGTKVSFIRLTPEEKRQIADIAYTYKSQGIKTVMYPKS